MARLRPQIKKFLDTLLPTDLVAIVRVRRYEQMAEVVPQRIAQVSGLTRTHTLMAFQYFSRHDLERMWGIGFESEA